ncbi:PQQ-dependent sugar dehydrogenase [Natronosporangium hydrolyticum]|uniref:PQQ-dependent sugar dehydrogenase n=1 Tax=Natronosporangium hydrolyticum TaxID=2811111 RepID=A0A895YA48_9ACTN|nr:PQQ-dependent sugar dehydrogenase [Natronosporangium hydrolyticum]QSB13132.1 PQQ-dependent sugar dehydrogenase [Natronosporangium hydrolyticum]
MVTVVMLLASMDAGWGERMRASTLMARAAVAGLVIAAGACSAADDPVEEPAPTGTGAATAPAVADTELVVETVVDGLDGPWGLAFLPDGEQLLVTQSAGILSVVDSSTGEIDDISGVPEVATGGQGGLLDVALDPDYPEAPWVYLTYSAADDSGGTTTTHLARGQLDLAEQQLDQVEVLYVAEPFLQSTAHYGSSIVFDDDGYLFMTVGDRGYKNFDDHPAQDPSTPIGTTLRLEPDGSVPADNPFVDDPEVADEIYSYGHRNIQGLTVHPETGEIWASEHGEQDGDEINVLEAGGNFGWPVATTACEYGTDTPLGEWPDEVEGTVEPVFYWECGSGGFPPAGLTFYTGDEFPQWQDDLLVGGLASEYLARLTVAGDQVEEAEPLLADEGWRIRDVAVGPHDGAIYVAVDGSDAPLLRLVNAD